MGNYKMLALDLDGTTLNEEGIVTDTTRYWIRKAVDSGVTVIFSTGRGMQTVSDLWSGLEMTGPMVLLNGAELWTGREQLCERHFLKEEEIRKLHKLAQEADAHFWGYSVESLTSRKSWTDEMFARKWMKFGMRHADPSVIAELRQLAAQLDTIEISRSAALNMEISPLGISKESGVRKICSLLGYDMSEVMAIGDNMNDYRLLRAARLGVAMGNADEELKTVADVQTDTNTKDGVAKAIQRYIFEIA
ncbi:hypothetical protein AMS62_12815 [Bacillus sp. FJAT-18019]|uniref:Phosphoglycolate phosphatase n=1 Tax=Paenibacillus solani TaxID=1705565 RepID=A0A0M1N2C0_9BACL|nr:Cof-type HAD-IIB family hydrolase [Paenibacillus solani]KOP66020.1 hypothetical protein AMS62_12815 [Bacillus sp. FJAT-18019]KOR76119.1 hypothetical protein AM231_26150 [Paenibacillus solani]